MSVSSRNTIISLSRCQTLFFLFQIWACLRRSPPHRRVVNVVLQILMKVRPQKRRRKVFMKQQGTHNLLLCKHNLISSLFLCSKAPTFAQPAASERCHWPHCRTWIGYVFFFWGGQLLPCASLYWWGVFFVEYQGTACDLGNDLGKCYYTEYNRLTKTRKDPFEVIDALHA